MITVVCLAIVAMATWPFKRESLNETQRAALTEVKRRNDVLFSKLSAIPIEAWARRPEANYYHTFIAAHNGVELRIQSNWGTSNEWEAWCHILYVDGVRAADSLVRTDGCNSGDRRLHDYALRVLQSIKNIEDRESALRSKETADKLGDSISRL